MKKYFKLLLEGSREYDPYDQRGSYFIHTKTHERVYSPGNTHAETVDELSDKFNYTSNPSHSPEDMVHHALRQGWVRIGQNTYNDSNGRGIDFYLQGNTEHELQSVVKFMGRGLKGTKFSLLIDKPLAPLSHHTDTHTYDTDTILDERDLERYTTHGHRIKPIEMTQNKSFVFNTALSVAPRTNRNTTNPSYVYKTIGDNYDPTLQERWSEYEVEKELRRTVEGVEGIEDTKIDDLPDGKFFIHPETGNILTEKTRGGGIMLHHDAISRHHGFENTNDAQSKGWVRGLYKKPKPGSELARLNLAGYHGHEVLRGVLSRFSHLFPHDTRFTIENCDREYGKMDSREFTGTEALNQYIQGGRINPIVAPTSTSTPTDYEVEKELRRTVPESQRTFESFTFSKLRTQLNEEHKDLIAEMHPIMFIHTDPTIPTYHVVASDINRKTHDEIAKDAIENHYTVKPSGNLSDQLLSLGGWTRIHTYPAAVASENPKKSFEIESASHEALQHTLRRIEPHISGHKVHIAVRDFGSGGEWSKRVDAEQLRDYIKYGHQARSLRVESWQEYDAKVGETNTSLFEPGNTKFDMKAFLKKLRKKYGVKENLPGEN